MYITSNKGKSPTEKALIREAITNAYETAILKFHVPDYIVIVMKYASEGRDYQLLKSIPYAARIHPAITCILRSFHQDE